MISAQIIKLFLINLLFLILVSPRASSSSSSSPAQDQPNSAKPIKTVHHRSMTLESSRALRTYQVFYIKNTTPFHLDSHVPRPREAARSSRILKRSALMKKAAMSTSSSRRKRIKKTADARPNFSVMLPKGFVPPSGSSPCHNGIPNSVVFFCANAKP